MSTGLVSCRSITQAAAEELRVSPEKVAVVMADFPAVPNDGTTAGSMTTPRTIPPVRQACAAARKMLVELACARWSLQPEAAQVQDGVITDKAGNRTLTYGELAKTQEAADAFKRAIPSDVTVTPVKEWKVLGTSFLRPNIKDLFLGAHKFPSDIIRPGMLYGKVLRAPSYGATLTSIDLAPARAMKDVIDRTGKVKRLFAREGRTPAPSWNRRSPLRFQVPMSLGWK